MARVNTRRRSGRPLGWVFALTVLVLAAGCGMAPVPVPVPAAGWLLWAGDGETGDLSQFQDTPWNLVGGDTPQIVTDPVRQGRYAIALRINRATSAADGICCGSRNEILPRFRDVRPADDLYFGFSTYLAPGFPTSGGWQVITQFKQHFDGSPPLSLNVEEDQFKIAGGYGHPDGPRPFAEPVGMAVTGQWIRWVLHVRFSANPSVGFVEVWKDSELVLPRYAPATGTLYPDPEGVDSSYLKIGYYRDQAIAAPGTIVFDDWRIGTSFEVVR